MTHQRTPQFRRTLVAGLCVLASACASGPDEPPVQIVGNDRDEHGCIGSAGYSWCAATQRCERPWELAAEQGFTLSKAGFDSYCSAPSQRLPQP